MNIKGTGKESSSEQGTTAKVWLPDLELKNILAYSAILPRTSLSVVGEIMLGSLRQQRNPLMISSFVASSIT